jgi:hypothetical protein
LYSTTAATVFTAMFPPALMTSVTLLSFFFSEVLTAKGYIRPQLDRFKYFFILVTISFWGVYIAEAIILGSNDTNINVLKSVSLLNALLFGLIEVFFLIVTILILQKLNKNKSKILKRLIPLTSFVGFGVLLFVIASIINVANSFDSFNPRQFFTAWTLFYISR